MDDVRDDTEEIENVKSSSSEDWDSATFNIGKHINLSKCTTTKVDGDDIFGEVVAMYEETKKSSQTQSVGRDVLTAVSKQSPQKSGGKKPSKKFPDATANGNVRTNTTKSSGKKKVPQLTRERDNDFSEYYGGGRGVYDDCYEEYADYYEDDGHYN